MRWLFQAVPHPSLCGPPLVFPGRSAAAEAARAAAAQALANDDAAQGMRWKLRSPNDRQVRVRHTMSHLVLFSLATERCLLS